MPRPRRQGDNPLNATETAALEQVVPPNHQDGFWARLEERRSTTAAPERAPRPHMTQRKPLQLRRPVLASAAIILLTLSAYQSVRPDSSPSTAVPTTPSRSALPEQPAQTTEQISVAGPLGLDLKKMTKRGNGTSTEKGWRMSSNGQIEQTIRFEGARYRIAVSAIGHSTGQEFPPSLALLLDGVSIAESLVEVDKEQTYTFELFVSEGEHLVAAAFTNSPNQQGLDADLEITQFTISPVPE